MLSRDIVGSVCLLPRLEPKLEKVLDVGMQFKHEYDFGSTTYLKLKVVSEYEGKKRRKKVKLLARNNQPVIKCSYCGNPAIDVCCQCVFTMMKVGCVLIVQMSMNMVRRCFCRLLIPHE